MTTNTTTEQHLLALADLLTHVREHPDAWGIDALCDLGQAAGKLQREAAASAADLMLAAHKANFG